MFSHNLFQRHNILFLFYLVSMASIVSSFSKFCLTLFLLVLFHGSTNAKLSTNFYSKSCPNLLPTVKSIVHSAIMKEARMGASLLRLFFHDCFVNVILLLLTTSLVLSSVGVVFVVVFFFVLSDGFLE